MMRYASALVFGLLPFSVLAGAPAQPSAAPEPGVFALLAAGAIGIALVSRRRK